MVGPGAGARSCGMGPGRARAGCFQSTDGRLVGMARADSLARLAWAYGLHLTRRRVTRQRSELPVLLETYAADGIRPLMESERERRPSLTSCINCGLCAFAANRVGRTRPPDLASSYMRI